VVYCARVFICDKAIATLSKSLSIADWKWRMRGDRVFGDWEANVVEFDEAIACLITSLLLKWLHRSF